MVKMTELEAKVVAGILASEYDAGQTVGKWVWSWSANKGFENKRSFPGAVASSVKKGFVTTEDYDGEDTITLTQLGYDTYNTKKAAEVTSALYQNLKS